MEFRNLENVRAIIKDATGLDVSYAYDDLVFICAWFDDLSKA